MARKKSEQSRRRRRQREFKERVRILFNDLTFAGPNGQDVPMEWMPQYIGNILRRLSFLQNTLTRNLSVADRREAFNALDAIYNKVWDARLDLYNGQHDRMRLFLHDAKEMFTIWREEFEEKMMNKL